MRNKFANVIELSIRDDWSHLPEHLYDLRVESFADNQGASNMRSVGKNPGSVAADLVAEDQLQSYVGAETSLAQLRMLVLLHAGNPHERLHIDTQIEARSTDATSGVPALRRSVWAAVLLTSLALTGCQAAMTNPTRSSDSPNSVTPSSGKETSLAVIADWPLRFTAHDFDAFCYSTYGCKIKYGNYRRINDPEDQLKLSSASVGSKYPSNLSASYGPIRNFPPPAVVIWRSKDGTPLRAEIDMAQIFNDQLILHNLKREEISTKGSVPLPQIILEVNDRTINVYMRATIWTKEEQIPGNKYSRARNDLIKAFSRTY